MGRTGVVSRLISHVSKGLHRLDVDEPCWTLIGLSRNCNPHTHDHRNMPPPLPPQHPTASQTTTSPITGIQVKTGKTVQPTRST